MEVNKKLRIAIFIDHDIIIRHFLHSGVFSKLMSNHIVDFVLPPRGYKRISLDVSEYIGKSRLITLKVNPFRRTLWARLRQVIILRSRLGSKNKIIRSNWIMFIPLKERLLQNFLGMPFIYSLYRLWIKYIENKNRNIELINILKEGQYDLIISPGVPDGVYYDELILECKRNAIPLIYIMNSWDNPCICPLVTGEPDLYLAWGPQTAELANDYLKIRKNKIIQFGAAQFEIYKNEPKINRNDFCKLNDLDPHKRIILYAGGSLGTNEYKHLIELEKNIESGKFDNLVILYRPHPWGGGINFEEKILKHNWKHVRIENNMKSYLENLISKGYTPLFPNYEDTNVVLSSVDCVISPLSTILLEALIVGKPIMCFMPLDEAKYNKRIKIVSELPFFKDFFSAEEVVLAKSLNEVIEKVPQLIYKSQSISEIRNLKKLKKRIIKNFSESYQNRIIKLVEEFVH